MRGKILSNLQAAAPVAIHYFLQGLSALAKIHGATIIRVHKMEIPQFGALIKIRYTWACDLQQGLA